MSKVKIDEYEKDFSEKSFWDKILEVAAKAGKEVIEKAVILYFVMQDDDTPMWAKGTILGALGYFVSPIDAIPDFIPVVGYTDDLTVLAGALVTVASHVKREHKDKAQEKMNDWFN